MQALPAIAKVEAETEPPNNKEGTDNPDAIKYNKLKRKFKALRDEYIYVLDQWEHSVKRVKLLENDKKFLGSKLECALKSQEDPKRESSGGGHHHSHHHDHLSKSKPANFKIKVPMDKSAPEVKKEKKEKQRHFDENP